MQFEAPAKRKSKATPARAATPKRADDDAPPIRCRACNHVITQTSTRREVAGRHVHLRLNPSAFAFMFGCFSTAPGCAIHGTPTEEATWFPGCRWQYAHCARCLVHLGWVFTGADSFFALLLERLAD